MSRSRKKKRGLFGQFSVREAFWLAILLHVILLVLPQSFNPFALFWDEAATAEPEPITMRFDQPAQPRQTELTEQPEPQEARTPEKSEDPPETEDPQVRGNTNFRANEAPRPSPQTQPQPEIQPRAAEQPVRRTGEELAEEETDVEEPAEEPQREAETNPDPLREQRSRLAREAIESFPTQNIGDVPMTFDNDLASSAEQAEGMIQFDTYDWNYEPYRAKMLRKIYREWVPKLYQIGFFRMGEPGVTVLSFEIQLDGSARAILIRDGARIGSYDFAAQQAVEALYPGLTTEFPPLPLDFPKDKLGVTIGYFVNTEPPRR